MDEKGSSLSLTALLFSGRFEASASLKLECSAVVDLLSPSWTSAVHSVARVMSVRPSLLLSVDAEAVEEPSSWSQSWSRSWSRSWCP